LPDEPIFLDTNIFMRFYTRDHPRMSEECRRLIEYAEAGNIEVTTSHLALAEIVWTLESRYRFPRDQIAAALSDVLDMRSLRVEHREMLREAVRAYAALNVDFIDAYHAADLRRRGTERICSYDGDFDTLGMDRVEPASVA
jgi:predicted nucleic acid-binding protein